MKSEGGGGSEEEEKAWWNGWVLRRYTPLWIAAIAMVVAFRLYETFSGLGYTLFSVAVAAPAILFPLLFPPVKFRHLPLSRRYSIQTNLWVGILSYIGNHFHTHYFYQVKSFSFLLCLPSVFDFLAPLSFHLMSLNFFIHFLPSFKVLGCRYTVPTDGLWSINDVPLCMYFLTHAYFMTYHVAVDSFLRWVKKKVQGGSGLGKRGERKQPRVGEGESLAWAFGRVLLTCALAYITALMETLTISAFPHYTYPSLTHMLTVGSAFYMLFLSVSFSMFPRVGGEGGKGGVWQVCVEALATAMMIFILYDLWRMAIPSLPPPDIDERLRADCSGCRYHVPYAQAR